MCKYFQTSLAIAVVTTYIWGSSIFTFATPPIQKWYVHSGVFLESQLLLKDQVAAVVKKAFAQFHLVCPLDLFLDQEPRRSFRQLHMPFIGMPLCGALVTALR